MSISNIRIFVRYNSLTNIVLLNNGIVEQEELIETVLDDLRIRYNDWKTFEIVIKKMDVKLRAPIS